MYVCMNVLPTSDWIPITWESRVTVKSRTTRSHVKPKIPTNPKSHKDCRRLSESSRYINMNIKINNINNKNNLTNLDFTLGKFVMLAYNNRLEVNEV